MFRKLKLFFMLAGLLCFALTLPAWARTPVLKKDSGQQRVSVNVNTSETMTIDKSSGVVPGDVLVVMKDSQSDSLSASDSESVRISAQAVKINSVAASVNARVKNTYPALSRISDNKIFALVHSDTKSENELLKELQANPDVLCASLNYKVFALATPNDPYYTGNKLWGLDAIKANDVWASGNTGAEDVYVAVLDTGIDDNHTDLSANFDSTYSKNYTNDSSYSYYDGNKHGSHVSGTIAGVGNNNIGVVGVNWKAKIIALKVLDNNGHGNFGYVVSALNDLSSLLAQDSSMKLAAINLSLGGYSNATPDYMEKNDTLWQAFKTFSDKNKAVICVAAGNENIKVGEPAPYTDLSEGFQKGQYCYPASFKGIANMIVVAASDNNNSYSRSSFSNYSTEYVDVAAPGKGIYSTVQNNNYASLSGTSMATPHVAGAAALLKSIVPGATAPQIKNAIIQGANKTYATDYTRYGFLDIEKALEILKGGQSSTIQLYISGSFSNGTVGSYYSSTVKAYGGTSSSYTWSNHTGNLPKGLNINYSGSTATLSGTPSEAGTYEFTLKVSNGSETVSKKFNVTISSQAQSNLVINGEFSNAFTWVDYSSKVTVSGGTSPYTWYYDGNVPNGLGLYYTDDSTHRGVELWGMPYSTGTYKFKLYAEDDEGNETSKTFTVKVSSLPRLSINGSISGGAGKGVSYNRSVSASGGLAPYSWSYTGTLPPGLGAYSSGTGANTVTIKGTPTASGRYSFVLNLKDSAGSSTSKYYSLKVTAPYFTYTFEDGVTDRYYSDSIYIRDAAEPYKLSYTGTLPAGLKLTHIGTTIVRLSGTPTKAGKYTFKLNLTDNNKVSITQSYTVNIAAAFGFSGAFKAGCVGKSYNSYITMTGGTKPYKLYYSGTIPDGLKTSISGTKAKLKGKPTKKGTYRLKLRLVDKKGKSTTKSFSIKIAQPVISGSFANGTVNKSYSKQVRVSGGNAPYKCTQKGKLPSGLKLTFSGTRAKLTGKPSKAGKYSFTLKFTDKNKFTVSKKFTVTISQAKSKAKKTSTAAKAQSAQAASNGSTGIAANGGLAHTAVINHSSPELGGGSATYIAPERIILRISDDDILDRANKDNNDEKDSDLFKVLANEPVTFIIEDYEKLSDVEIFFDFKPYEGDDIEISDDGEFTIPAELVHDDFVVSVHAKINNHEAESEEIYINAE